MGSIKPQSKRSQSGKTGVVVATSPDQAFATALKALTEKYR